MDENMNPVIVTDQAASQPLTAQEIKGQVQRIQEVMQAVMEEGYHYGVIPGTQKPTLLKPGAEKLIVTFRLAPLLEVERIDLGSGHREYQVKCTLVHIPTGRTFGEGIGSCSTLESKYRWRQGERLCPHCGRATIIKGKAEYGGGWLCFAKKGGCGAKFAEHDTAITSQSTGRAENPDIADVYNTVLKMSKKRALVDATLTATAASDIFTQDLEQEEGDPTPAPVGPPPTAAPTRQPPPPKPPVATPPVAPPLKTEVKADPASELPITQGQRRRLFALMKEAGVNESEFKDFLKQAYGWDSTATIPQSKYEVVCENLTDGSVQSFLLDSDHPE